MSKFLRWLPAVVMSLLIFTASATSASKIPSYGAVDGFVKKGGHFSGYALLSLSYWYGFSFESKKGKLALLMALAFALTDEYHQSFTPGRHPSIVDVLLFDGGGAVFGLSALAAWFRWHKRPGV